jgi:hypothetical protein
MIEKLFLENKTTGRKYKVLRFDKEANKLWLTGDYGEFDVEFDKENLKKMGYALVREQVEEEAA